jgi:predicted Fe-S protein YdhL (DUF1289 family)
MKTEDLSKKASSEAPAQAAGGQKRDEWAAVDSPCVAICSTLFDDICRGCGRSVIEVSNWVLMTEEEKKAVWVRIRAQGYPRRL